LTKSRSGPRRPSRGASGGVRRADRIAAEIQRIVSEQILRGARDPRVEHVTVTRVRVNDDLRLARVWFTLLEVDESNKAAALAGLASATPYFRRTVAGELGLRHAPELVFAYDEDLADARRIDAILRDLKKERAEHDSDEGAHGDEHDDEGGEGGGGRDA